MAKKKTDSIKNVVFINLHSNPELLPGLFGGFAGQLKLATKLSRGRFCIDCSLPGPLGKSNKNLFIVPKGAVESVYPL